MSPRRISVLSALVTLTLMGPNCHHGCLLAQSRDESVNEKKLDPEGVAFFEKKIRPVLVRECYGCHSDAAGNVRGGLRLDTSERTLIGGSDGAAVVPGDPDSSLLYLAILHEGYEMPPRGKLPDDVISDFEHWISIGAPDPRVNESKISVRSLDSETIAKAKNEHWALRPIAEQVVPELKDEAWVWSDVDRFVLGALESRGLKPAGDCTPDTLIRRLSFDLTGLPPSPAEVAAFVAACRKDRAAAIEQTVERLLASEDFGRRWGRHWMDVVRYAESTGSTVNMTYPHAWRYRDYIIDSYNDDKPFNDFLCEQIAGDLLPAADDQQWAKNLVATTFLAVGPKTVNESNRTQFRADVIDEQINAVGQVFLAQSIACARCHDHKFDPIGQADYYALAGMFMSTETYFGSPPSDLGSYSPAQVRRTSSLMLLPGESADPVAPRYTRRQVEEMRDEMQQAKSEIGGLRRSRDSNNLLQQRLRLQNKLFDLTTKLGAVDRDGNPRAYTMGVQDIASPTDAPFLERGEIDARGPSVPRGIPEVLVCGEVHISDRESGRLQLARNLSLPEHPLTARVYVNRVWQKIFGRGIVASVDNFGTTGDQPSHPELLDQLAVDFVSENWSTKKLIRRLVTSRIYQTASTYHADAETLDPNNELLWRRSPTRLDAESIRDSMLAVAGVLDLSSPAGCLVASVGYTRVRGDVLGNPRDRIRARVESEMGGGSGSRGNSRSFRLVRQMQQELQNELDGVQDNVRSVYLPMVRDVPPRSLQVFDMADANRVLGTREVSHTADQALYMMNNPLVHRAAREMADRVCATHSDPNDRIQRAFELAFSRPPSRRERLGSRSFITEMMVDPQIDPWTIFCQSLMASAEFRIID